MALKKSELYSSLWSSCDELRGGMDATQYKDYVLVLLLVKLGHDKYAGVPYAPITIPTGASFKDMVALKGKPDIGTPEYLEHKRKRFKSLDQDVAKSGAFTLQDENIRQQFEAEYAKTAPLYYRGQIPFDKILARIQKDLARL